MSFIGFYAGLFCFQLPHECLNVADSKHSAIGLFFHFPLKLVLTCYYEGVKAQHPYGSLEVSYE